MINEFSGKYRWLSNFTLCPIILNGIIYPSTENAYQASKTQFVHERQFFITCSPGKAKKMGKSVTMYYGFNDDKLSIMEKILNQKFQEGTYLSEKLINTGNQEIIEGNNWNDTYWGVCDNIGHNHLGKLIMKIRDKLNEN